MDETPFLQQPVPAGKKSLHFAPKSSPRHLALRAAARLVDLEDVLRNLFWLINASNELLRLRRIAGNLKSILEAFDYQLGIESSSEESSAIFRGWPDLLTWIEKRWPAWDSSADAAAGNPNKDSVFIRNPLYACVWERREENWTYQYLRLQGHLLWAHAHYLYKESQHSTLAACAGTCHCRDRAPSALCRNQPGPPHRVSSR